MRFGQRTTNQKKSLEFPRDPAVSIPCVLCAVHFVHSEEFYQPYFPVDWISRQGLQKVAQPRNKYIFQLLSPPPPPPPPSPTTHLHGEEKSGHGHVGDVPGQQVEQQGSQQAVLGGQIMDQQAEVNFGAKMGSYL